MPASRAPVALAFVALAPEAQAAARATPLLILHGLFGSSANWRTLARRLAGHRPVFLLDARNHGRSPHAPGMSYEEQADDLGAFLDHHRIATPILLGHSMGGKTAMHFALTRPCAVGAVIAVDIAPVDYAEAPESLAGVSHAALIEAMLALPLATLPDRRAADAALAPTVADPILRSFLLHNLTRDHDRLAWRINLPALASALAGLRAFPAPAGRTYAGPALFLAGSHSPYVRTAHRTVIRGLFPRAEIAVVEGAGHWVHAEQPEAVLAHIERFTAHL